MAAAQLGAHVARQRGGGRDQLVGVIEAGVDQTVEQGAGIGVATPSSCGDAVDVDAAGAVQAHRQGFFGGVGGERARRAAVSRSRVKIGALRAVPVSSSKISSDDTTAQPGS